MTAKDTLFLTLSDLRSAVNVEQLDRLYRRRRGDDLILDRTYLELLAGSKPEISLERGMLRQCGEREIGGVKLRHRVEIKLGGGGSVHEAVAFGDIRVNLAEYAE